MMVDRFWVRPFLRVPMGVPYWDKREILCILGALFYRSERLNGNIERLELKICQYFDVRFCICTDFGRQAIELGLRALELQPGEGVILPSFTCVNVLRPIINVGCIPQFVDIDEDLNMNPDSICRVITSKSRAIIMPHLFGMPAQVGPILEIARRHNLFVIDDAAQALGAKWKGRFVGTMGDVGILSFGPFKGVMATRGGALITNNEDIYKKAMNIPLKISPHAAALDRALKSLIKFKWRKYTYNMFLLFRHLKKSNEKNVIINNSLTIIEKMSALDAAIVRIQLEKLPEILKRRKERARYMQSLLADSNQLRLPRENKGCVYTKLILDISKIRKMFIKGKRAKHFIHYLRICGIEAEHTYTPLHLQKEFKRYGKDDLDRTESIWENLIALPMNPDMTKEDVTFIAEQVKRFFHL